MGLCPFNENAINDGEVIATEFRGQPCQPSPCRTVCGWVAECRRELKGLKDAARERLAVAHAQEKEKTLTRLRRSLSRGTGHSVSGLQGELWEEAHEKRER